MFLGRAACTLKRIILLYLTYFSCRLVVLGSNENEERPGGSYVYKETRPSQMNKIPVWDPNGYVLFCLCMGRVGNQLEHLLGGMAFAKAINRTLVLPPFRTYRNVRFTEWFKFDPLEDFHRVVLAEDFMEFIAPTYWPPGKRLGFCWKLPADAKDANCNMKEGNPFGPFWDGLNVSFDGSVVYHLSYGGSDLGRWSTEYPAEKYPVLAFRGAPASFPMAPQHRELQKYLVFSDRVEDEANKYIFEHFPDKHFVGLHLRNGPDWASACNGANGQKSYMASPQCLEGTTRTITTNMCFPPESEILRITKNVVIKNRLKVVFVATDKNSLVHELREHLKNQNVEVYHADPWLPLVDWAILIKSDHFIGNCVSSFTSFVKRARDVRGLPTSFWGLES